MSRPFVVVVTGRPGSGKTTLAHKLARRVRCPALCRDEFKEGYVHTMGGRHESLGEDANRKVYEIFFETVSFLVSLGISVVIEAAFQHKLWLPKLTEIGQDADIGIIVCSLDPDIARSRWVERGLTDSTRERFHGDNASHVAQHEQSWRFRKYDPPDLPFPTMTVDTTDDYKPGLDSIVDFASNIKVAQGTKGTPYGTGV